MTIKGKFYIARHGETIFNADRRIQGALGHTPFTRAGFAQIDAMGAALAKRIAPDVPLDLWVSPTGRTLQTLAILCEHLGRDWHGAHRDERLVEIGMGSWDGRFYADIVAEHGPIYSESHSVFTHVAPDGGESYAEVRARLEDWLATLSGDADRLIVTHGVTAAVLRGVLTGGDRRHPVCGTAVAGPVPQGSLVAIENGVEEQILVLP
jgi:glucosyl-3-phosphoglycerate phosphatase